MVIKSSNKLIALFAVLLVILCSGHALQTIFPVVSQLVLPVSVIVLLFELSRLRSLKINTMQVTVLVFGVMFGATFLVHLGSGASYYLMMMCNVLVGYGLARMYSFRQIARCHVRVMTVVTAVAIVGYFLVNNTTVLASLPAMSNVNDVEYRVGFVFNYIPEVLDRNCGMFWEPGLFATHLIISVVFEILFEEKPSILRLLLFSVGIFTANSSAGFALWLLCVMLLFVKRINVFKNVLGGALGIIALLIGIAVIANFDQILAKTALGDNEYLQKLATDSVMDSSRIKAMEHNLKLFLSAPIFGVGIGGASSNMQHVADTATSTYLMSIFGILGVAYTFYWIYGIVKLPKVNVLVKILLLAITLIILNKEPHTQLLLSWCLMFALIRGDFSPLENEEVKAKKRKIVLKWG